MASAPDEQAPLLVTGLPRSGSSWVGQVLCRAPGVRYRYESLNPHWVPALRGRPGHFRYLAPDRPGPKAVRRAGDRALAGRQSPKQLLRALYRGYGRAALRRRGRLVLKDPTACLLAGWLQARHGGEVLVLVRHPCGFASSIQRLGWPIRLRRLLDQDDLVRDHLEPYLPVLEQSIDDPWAALGAFWAAVHRVLRAQAGDGWHFVRYETLCLAPTEAFGTLARNLGLDLAPSATARTGPHREDPGSTAKDSRRMASIWHDRMSRDAQEAVMGPVEALGLKDWSESGRAQDEA